MAAHYSSALPLQVTSPFLKNSEVRDSKDVRRADKIEVKRRGETVEPSNIISLESSFGQQSTPEFTKYRPSREIFRVDEGDVTAPDNATVNIPKKPTSNGAESEVEGEYDGDNDSIAYGGSIASTVPDRYGFMGGVQQSFDRA